MLCPLRACIVINIRVLSLLELKMKYQHLIFTSVLVILTVCDATSTLSSPSSNSTSDVITEIASSSSPPTSVTTTIITTTTPTTTTTTTTTTTFIPTTTVVPTTITTTTTPTPTPTTTSTSASTTVKTTTTTTAEKTTDSSAAASSHEDLKAENANLKIGIGVLAGIIGAAVIIGIIYIIVRRRRRRPPLLAGDEEEPALRHEKRTYFRPSSSFDGMGTNRTVSTSSETEPMTGKLSREMHMETFTFSNGNEIKGKDKPLKEINENEAM